MSTKPAETQAAAQGGTEDAATGRAGQAPADPDALPLDVVFDILKNSRRRLVIHYLIEEEPETTLSDLAEHIAALENEKTVQALSSDERKRVYVCLYQCHLPKMDDAGIIDFESDRGRVELRDDPEPFTRYIDVEAEADGRDWPRYYVGLAAVGGVGFLLQQLLLPMDLLTGILMGVLLGMFVNLALEHALQRGILKPGVPGVDRGATATS